MREMPSRRDLLNTLCTLFGVAVVLGHPILGMAETIHDVPRGIPEPTSSHPGNVFLEDEDLSIPPPDGLKGAVRSWRLLDEQLAELRQGSVESASSVQLGRLPVGWYRMEFLDEYGELSGFSTAAVLARLRQATPQDSPVCLDAALSWLGGENPKDWEALAKLAALAGVNWIRDRIHWREVQSAPGVPIPNTKYDAAAEVQAKEGLKVLQVFHTAPPWARREDPGSTGSRPDLRHVYDFCKAMAERFQDTVQAWEPWNEANAGNFGGWTISEMCAHQKAAYLGFKAGNPSVTVGWNPIGGSNTIAQATGILKNETWPYFDVYGIHSYDWPHDYERLWAPARDAASGKPIWVTECDRGMETDPASDSGDFTHPYSLLKARFMAQSYASSLFAGATRHFHFILGDYREQNNKIQFGLLRKDMTPRPSYVALAALGRFLADARSLGRWELEGEEDAYVYAFRAQPDGIERDVLVAWAETRSDWPSRGAKSVDWALPAGIEVKAVYDYLGRQLGEAAPPSLHSAPVFVLLKPGEAAKLALRQLKMPATRQGDPSLIVLEFSCPDARTEIRQEAWTQEPLYAFGAGEDLRGALMVHNFGPEPASGDLMAPLLPEGWSVRLAPDRVTLDPFQSLSVPLEISVSPEAQEEEGWILFRGDFGGENLPVAAIQAIARKGTG